MKHQQTSLQPVAKMLRHFDKKLACVAGVGKGGEWEFQAQEKRKGWGAQGGREENVYQETIVFTILPTNNVYRNNATVNDQLSNKSGRNALKKKFKCGRPLKEESCNDVWLVI